MKIKFRMKRKELRDKNLHKLYLIKIIFRRTLIIIIKSDVNKNVS